MAIGELVVKIVGDASDLSRELADAAKTSDNFATKARDSLNIVGVALGAVGAAAGAAFGVMVADGIRAAHEIKNLSNVANASAEEFQRMAYAAQSVGIEQDKLADILKDVNDRVGDFITTGAGPMADFFERVAPRVGVTVEQFKKLSGPEALGLYVDTLDRAGLSQQEITFFMEQLASDSTRLVPLLKDNAAGLAAMAAEAESLGLVTSAIDIGKIEAARTSMANVSAVGAAFNRQLAAETAPLLEQVADWFKQWAIEFGGFDKVARATVDGFAAGMGYIGDVMRGWSVIIQGNIALLRLLAAEAGNGIKSIADDTREWRNSIFKALDDLAMSSPYKIDLGLQKAAAESEKQMFNFADSMNKVAQDSIDELRAMLAQPLPSDELQKRLEQWRTNADAAAASVEKARASATGGSSTVITPTVNTAESDQEIQAIRERLKQRSATFETWRKSQADANGNYEKTQLALFVEYQKIRSDELRAAHAREDLILEDRFKRGLLKEQEYNALKLQLERDQNAQLVEARAQGQEELAAMTSTRPLGFDPLGEQGGDTVRAIRERLQGEFDTMAEYNALQLEQLQTQQDQELAILQARRDADLISLAEFNELAAGIDAEGARKRKEIAEAEGQAKRQIWGGIMDNLSSLMQSGSRKMFEVGKAASIAGGLISAYESVMHAYKAGAKVGGPYLGAAYAAAAAVAQAANLRRLSSVSFGSQSGSVQSSSGGGVPSAAGATSGGGGETAAPAMPSRNISISLAGSSFSADTVRELITQINEQIGDGATIRAT